MTGSLTAESRTPDARSGRPLLEVVDLRISIPTEAGLIEAVRGVSFSMQARDTLGVVGESGSGKTMLALAAMGLVPGSAKVSGSIRLDGRELLHCTPAQWRSIRGALPLAVSPVCRSNGYPPFPISGSSETMALSVSVPVPTGRCAMPISMLSAKLMDSPLGPP